MNHKQVQCLQLQLFLRHEHDTDSIWIHVALWKFQFGNGTKHEHLGNRKNFFFLKTSSRSLATAGNCCNSFAAAINGMKLEPWKFPVSRYRNHKCRGKIIETFLVSWSVAKLRLSEIDWVSGSSRLSRNKLITLCHRVITQLDER